MVRYHVDEISLEKEAERKIGWVLKLFFAGTATFVGYQIFPYLGMLLQSGLFSNLLCGNICGIGLLGFGYDFGFGFGVFRGQFDGAIGVAFASEGPVV